MQILHRASTFRVHCLVQWNAVHWIGGCWGCASVVNKLCSTQISWQKLHVSFCARGLQALAFRAWPSLAYLQWLNINPKIKLKFENWIEFLITNYLWCASDFLHRRSWQPFYRTYIEWYFLCFVRLQYEPKKKDSPYFEPKVWKNVVLRWEFL